MAQHDGPNASNQPQDKVPYKRRSPLQDVRALKKPKLTWTRISVAAGATHSSQRVRPGDVSFVRPPAPPTAVPTCSNQAQRLPAAQQHKTTMAASEVASVRSSAPQAQSTRTFSEPAADHALPPKPQQRKTQQQQSRTRHSGELSAEQEMRLLQAKIAQEQRKLQAQQVKVEQERASTEAQEQAAAQRKHERLAKGFAQLLGQDDDIGGDNKSVKPLLDVANEAEVMRVLEARTNYQVMQLRIGCDAAAVRRRYRELAFALHPDKCKVPRAAEAFQKVKIAQESLLKFLS